MSREGPASHRPALGREWHLSAPVPPDDIEGLRAGDIVYLSGPAFTARDGVYRHMLVEGHQPPVDLRALTNVSFQSSPAGVEVAPGQYRVSSFQATAGFRYAQYVPALLERYNVKVLVGKAGMSQEVYAQHFRPHRAVCLTTMGYGLGAIYGRAITRVIDVIWAQELGISEALWNFEAMEEPQCLMFSERARAAAPIRAVSGGNKPSPGGEHAI